MVSLDHDDTSPSAVASLERCGDLEGGMQERESSVFKSVSPDPDRADSFPGVGSGKGVLLKTEFSLSLACLFSVYQLIIII